jgi:hypothetical protein
MMVVANRFRWFGWFVLCVSVILGCYLMSSKVAAERNKLAAVEMSIARTQRDIKALETEFDTRASFVQLQRWNGDTLKLSAPTAAQYIRDDAQLAEVDFNAPAATSAGMPQIQTAAAVIPSAPVIPADAAVPAARAQAQAQASAAPAKIKAAVAMISAPVGARLQPAAAKAPAKARLATVALLDRKLLSDSTLGSLSRGAREEVATR